MGLLAVAAWGISSIDAPLPLWIVFLACILVTGGGFLLGRLWQQGSELQGYQADLLGEAMLALREVLAGKLSVSFEELMERGVLAPARFGLSAEHGEDIRLSVLEPDGEAESFRMIFESGHSLGRKEDFSLPRASLAGHALETEELQWANDVRQDDRWHIHPKADDARSYGSLVCMPIVVGDKPLAVLNVLSSEKGAFLKSDLTYIELLGGFIGLAWALADDAAASPTLLRASKEAQAANRKVT